MRLTHVWLTLLALLVGGGCNFKGTKISLPGTSDGGVVLSGKVEIQSVLRSLFPSLSDDEVSALSGKLSLSDALALRSELEKVRKSVVEFSRELFKTSEERVATRNDVLADHNNGYPEGVAALGQVCTYSQANGHADIRLSGVFKDQQAVALDTSQLRLTVDGKSHAFELACLAGGPSVDIVFLIDITGSMSNVIASVRDSVVSFVDHIESSDVRGTVSVVTFQDSVGVNRTFQDPAPANGYERSPFFTPVDLSKAEDVAALRAFVNRLEANRGNDAPENLAGAIDFARNSVIGYMANGEPNVIGDGREDPTDTAAFPELKSDRQVFVVLTDSTFHGDDRTPANSSLLKPFVPRDAAEIVATLQSTGTTVHVSDPSWVDASENPADDPVDADYWAVSTGGVGEDVVEGYSLVDLELVVVAKDAGLLDIALDKIIETSCTLSFDAQLSAQAKVELTLDVGGTTHSSTLPIVRL